MWMRSRLKAWMLALDLFVQRRKTNYRHHLFDLREFTCWITDSLMTSWAVAPACGLSFFTSKALVFPFPWLTRFSARSVRHLIKWKRIHILCQEQMRKPQKSIETKQELISNETTFLVSFALVKTCNRLLSIIQSWTASLSPCAIPSLSLLHSFLARIWIDSSKTTSRSVSRGKLSMRWVGRVRAIFVRKIDPTCAPGQELAMVHPLSY